MHVGSRPGSPCARPPGSRTARPRAGPPGRAECPRASRRCGRVPCPWPPATPPGAYSERGSSSAAPEAPSPRRPPCPRRRSTRSLPGQSGRRTAAYQRPASSSAGVFARDKERPKYFVNSRVGAPSIPRTEGTPRPSSPPPLRCSAPNPFHALTGERGRRHGLTPRSSNTLSRRRQQHRRRAG